MKGDINLQETPQNEVTEKVERKKLNPKSKEWAGVYGDAKVAMGNMDPSTSLFPLNYHFKCSLPSKWYKPPPFSWTTAFVLLGDVGCGTFDI